MEGVVPYFCVKVRERKESVGKAADAAMLCAQDRECVPLREQLHKIEIGATSRQEVYYHARLCPRWQFAQIAICRANLPHCYKQ